ncbi:hypothetical protein, partial [Bacteroides thetaiotaomicron]|uniref:hypothetical protein n=1 Tax=Bacteroides thetaiotaomicron TaxID=818 RepID=UPI00319DFABA
STPDQPDISLVMIAEFSPAAVPGQTICYHFVPARELLPEKSDSRFCKLPPAQVKQQEVLL